MAMYQLLFLILWVVTLETSHLSNRASPKTDYMTALNQTVKAIDRLMSFYEENVNQVNLDSIFGLRVTEGALFTSLKKHSSLLHTTKAFKHVYQKLNQLRRQAGLINEQAQVSIKEQSNEYYFTFKDVVDKPWSFFKEFGRRKLPKSKIEMIKHPNKNSSWDEDMSDRCMSEALGTNSNHTECMFTPACIGAITDQNQVGYGPTHQVLFLTVALIHGCQDKYSKVLKEHLRLGVDDLIEDRCVRVMNEMLRLETPVVNKSSRDLYMEQAFVCGLHGYEEFLTLKRLKVVLSWQRKVGCFGKQYDDGTPDDDEEQTGTLIDRDGHRSQRNAGSFKSMRRLLVDVTVGNGCSAHESGVAAGLLGVYTSWLLSSLNPGKGVVITTQTTENSKMPNHRTSDSLTTTYRHSVANLGGTSTTSDSNDNNNNGNSNDNNNGNSNNNNQANGNDYSKNTLTVKDIYIRSMVISVVSSLLTVTVVLSLYALGSRFSCHKHLSKKGKYRPLVDA